MDRRFEPIAERYLVPVVRGQSEFMCACPFCDSEASLQFNVDSGLWVCFRCDEKGSSKTLVKRMGGHYADPVVSTEFIRARIDRIRTDKKNAERSSEPLEERYLSRFDFPDEYWLEDRGFSAETVRRWNLGYDPIKDRHTIAFRDESGDLLGIIYRLKGDVFPRYIYPKNFNRKRSLFGSWQVTKSRIALVEGSTDVIALSDVGIESVAQYGSSTSKEQARLLLRLGVREVVLFFDYDEAGRKAGEWARSVLRDAIISIVVWDSEKYCWHKKLCGCGDHDWRTIGKCQEKRLCDCGRIHEADPGSLNPQEAKAMFDNAKKVGGKEWQKEKSARSRSVQRKRQ